MDTTVDKLKVVLEGEDGDYLQVIEQAEQKTISMVNGIIAAGARMTAALTTSLGAISAVSIASFADFDSAMVQSTAIMSGMTAELRTEMSDLAIQMSTETTSSATSLAQAYEFLGSSGLTAKQSMEALSVVNSFSIAGHFNLSSATDMLADSQSALGLKVEDSTQNMKNMARVADVLTQANILSNASVEQFATSLTTKTAAALKGLNKDVEEGVAVLAAYADQGIKAQLSGEKLAVLLRESQTAAAKNADEWKKYNVELYENGKMIPIVDLIRQLEKATAGMSDEMKFATFHTMGFRAESMDAIKPLLGMSDKIAKYEKSLRSAGGVTEDIAKNQMVSFSAQMTIMKNQLTAVAIDIGRILAPSVLKMNQVMAQAISYWKGMSEEMKVVLVTSGKIVSVIGPAMVSFGLFARMAPMLTANLGAMMSNIGMAFTWLRTVGLVAALPFIKIIAVVALVSAAIYGLAYLIMGPEGLSSAWDAAHANMTWFFGAAIGFLANFSTNMGIWFNWMRSNWQLIVTDMLNLWITYMGNMISNAFVVIQTLTRLWVAWIGWLYVYVPKFFQYIFSEEFLKAVYQGFISALKATNEFMKQTLMLFVNTFLAIDKVFRASIGAMLGVAIEFAKALGGVFSRILRGEIPNPAELIKDFMAKAGTQLSAVSHAVGEAVGVAGEVAAEKLKAAQEQAVKDFNKGGSQLNFFATAGDIIGEGMSALKSPFDGFKSSISELPQFVLGETDKMAKSMDAIEPPAMDTETTLVEPLAAAEVQADKTAAAVKGIQEAIEGSAMGSLDAAIKIDDYFARLAASSKDASTSATTATQAGKAGNLVVAKATTVTPATTGNAETQRGTMIELLTDIRNDIRKPSSGLMAANFGS